MTTSYTQVFGFFGDFRFLSNFYVEDPPSPVTGEHRFQSYKTLDLEERAYILRAPTPGVAKFRGRHVELRADWEEVRDYYMALNIAIKFQNPVLRERLLLTGDAELVEANRWGDTYWGVDQDSGVGENRLGKLLMVARQAIRDKTEDQYPWEDAEGGRWSHVEGGTRVREADGAASEWATESGLTFEPRS